MSDDPFNLRRFVAVQQPVFEQVLAELKQGRKASHWMWFIFPQIAGLGSSHMAKRFAISSRAEAEAFLKHAILGFRLKECVRLVNAIENRTIEEIFGYPDDLKFRSSMTLFSEVETEDPVFRDALQKYFDGKLDSLTIERMSTEGNQR